MRWAGVGRKQGISIVIIKLMTDLGSNNKKRLIFITLECHISTFSGNGVYSRSQIRSLRELGHRVLVICGRPDTLTCHEDEDDCISVPLPAKSWGRLDAHSSFSTFSSHTLQLHKDTILNFNPDAIFAVDWHGMHVINSVKPHLCYHNNSTTIPITYLNYRVHTKSVPEDQRALIRSLEHQAVLASTHTVALCTSDAQYIQKHFIDSKTTTSTDDNKDDNKKVKVLLPALRQDMAAIPPPADEDDNDDDTTTMPLPSRNLLTCCVRISPEKEPHRFVDIVEHLMKMTVAEEEEEEKQQPTVPPPPSSSSSPSILQQIQPFICGSGWNTPYGQSLCQRIKHSLPNCIIKGLGEDSSRYDHFMGPTELASIFSRSILNIHPCGYDAYGMTIVEAASQGCPSLVCGGGQVGATELLREEAGEVVCVVGMGEMSGREVAGRVWKVLMEEMEIEEKDGGEGGERKKKKKKVRRLEEVGRRAAIKAREWTEQANAIELLSYVFNEDGDLNVIR